MSPSRRSRSDHRRPQQPRRTTPIDIWRPGGPLPAVEPITVPEEVDALLKSLGDPPISSGAVMAGHYFTAVVERAAAVAAALAFSADLLAQPTDD